LLYDRNDYFNPSVSPCGRYVEAVDVSTSYHLEKNVDDLFFMDNSVIGGVVTASSMDKDKRLSMFRERPVYRLVNPQ
jgi:hypothetical protein